MPKEFVEKMIRTLLPEVTQRLQEALACAKAAEAYVADGKAHDALRIALDVETFTYEANALLNAAGIIAREVDRDQS